MDMLKKLFPLSFKEKSTVKDLVIAIIFYIAADIACGIVISLLGALPLVGWIFNLIGSVLGLYFFVGLVLVVLDYLKVFKQ